MHVLRTKVDSQTFRQVMAYCRVRTCSPGQFLHAAIKTELREMKGNAPFSQVDGDNNRVTQHVTNNNTTNVNVLSNNTVKFLNDVRFFLFPFGGSAGDWWRALILYAAGGATVLLVALNT